MFKIGDRVKCGCGCNKTGTLINIVPFEHDGVFVYEMRTDDTGTSLLIWPNRTELIRCSFSLPDELFEV